MFNLTPLMKWWGEGWDKVRRILLLILVIGVLLLSACGSAPTTALLFTGGPRISFDQDSVYLGKATPDQRLQYEFSFQNIGDAQLIVYGATAKILAGC